MRLTAGTPAFVSRWVERVAVKKERNDKSTLYNLLNIVHPQTRIALKIIGSEISHGDSGRIAITYSLSTSRSVRFLEASFSTC